MIYGRNTEQKKKQYNAQMFKCKYRVYSAKKDEIKGIKTNNQKLTNKQKKL